MRSTKGLKIGDVLVKVQRDESTSFSRAKRVKVTKIEDSNTLYVDILDGATTQSGKTSSRMCGSLRNFELEPKNEIYEIY